MGACGLVDRVLNSRLQGLWFDSHCWLCVEVSGKLVIPTCLWLPSSDGYLVEWIQLNCNNWECAVKVVQVDACFCNFTELTIFSFTYVSHLPMLNFWNTILCCNICVQCCNLLLHSLLSWGFLAMYLLFYSVCSSLLIYVLTYKLQIYVYYFIIFY